MKNQTAGSRIPQAIVEDIIVQNLGDEVLVYNVKTHRAMSLNSTVACVWKLCTGKNSLSEIKKLAEIELKSLLPDEAITLAIDELKRHDLLIAEDGSDSPSSADSLSSVSRRALIRKVGISVAVAIPVITAITAPKAVQAQSLLPDGAGCGDDTECQNNCCFNTICQPAAVCFGP